MTAFDRPPLGCDLADPFGCDRFPRPPALCPRYAPKPGQLLTYEENQSFKGRGEDSRYKTTWRLWVTGRNDDGSWRIVAREGMKTLREKASSPGEQEMVTFARFDLYPDGNVPRSPTLGMRLRPISPLSPPTPRREGGRRRLAGARRPRRHHDPLRAARS